MPRPVKAGWGPGDAADGEASGAVPAESSGCGVSFGSCVCSGIGIGGDV